MSRRVLSLLPLKSNCPSHMTGFSLLTVTQKILRRVPFAKLDVNCLNCLEYYPIEGNATTTDGAILIRAAIPTDIDPMGECGNFPERLPERFAANEHCVVGISGGKVIGYQWFCDKSLRTEERYGYIVEIPSDAVYGYDAFVVPNHRRSKVWTQFHTQYLGGLLASLGRNRVIVMVDQNNNVSMKAHLGLGYRLYRKVYIFVVFGKCFWIAKDSRSRMLTQECRPTSPTDAAKQVTSFV